MVDPEPAPGPAEPGHHLVGDEQHAMPPADVRDRRPVAVGRDGGGQRGADDRLRDERRDVARAGRLERPVELGGELVGVAEGVGTGQVGAVRVGRRDVAEAPEPALVRPAQRLAPGQVERAQGVAVIAAPAGVDDPALRLAAGEVIGAGQLERGLDRLGAARHRVDRRIVDGQVASDLAGVRLERLGRERAAVRVGQASGLVRHRRRDLAAAVADVDHDRATGGIEVLAPVRVADRRAVRLDRDRRLGGARSAKDAAGAHGRIVADETPDPGRSAGPGVRRVDVSPGRGRSRPSA